MKILIVTQAIDRHNPVLGFFHRWVEEFAQNFEKITVICLIKGDYDLPSNVEVRSLGKEAGVSRLKYIFNFYKYIWQERKNYDAVFVHMNQEYVLLGFPIWLALRKRICMWRNHKAGSFLTRVAVMVSKNVFCTSPFSYTAIFKKTVIMPVGIDTEAFKPDLEAAKNEQGILFLGRIAPVKKVDVIVDALILLPEENVDFCASIYGDALPRNISYYDGIKSKVKVNDLGYKIVFHKGVANSETPKIYSSNSIFINITEDGSFDKTIHEAMACGSAVLTSNSALKGEIMPDYFISEIGPSSIATALKRLLDNPDLLKNSMRDYVISHHSLRSLVSKFKAIISSNA